ncbi:trafficking protein particle complex subunit-like protein [Dinothrombium tinctorium]|uniref:Trafficking protein particle complex subunit n=1 Tax=Dinothrombium tinctorium TaxID=1965070 RepID=A0A443RDQ2_9ACAR|nr:trafficking protein particle complex subunit-like protein [Dinothrombium tinctorium]RWS05071.1 trafficking protein particle complex subunit-like protein [Dinothrombium tinctorium]RWS13396.1 trafficking protein particle complex subunit-like protein [Dinothrombium tinctorium]
MSRSTIRSGDPKKVSTDLFCLTYGSLVSQLLKDSDTPEDVNKQLERMGYNIGLRLVEDFLAKTASPRCLDFKDVAEKIQSAFKMYAGITPSIVNWSSASDEFSLVLDNNPLIESVELPDNLLNLKYCNILPGIIRGALEMVQIEVNAWFVQDYLKGDATTELRVKFIKKLEEALPPGED